MCSRTRENNKNKVETVMWDTLYIGLTPMIFPWGVTDYLTRQLQVIVKCLECILHILLM